MNEWKMARTRLGKGRESDTKVFFKTFDAIILQDTTTTILPYLKRGQRQKRSPPSTAQEDPTKKQQQKRATRTMCREQKRDFPFFSSATFFLSRVRDYSGGGDDEASAVSKAVNGWMERVTEGRAKSPLFGVWVKKDLGSRRKKKKKLTLFLSRARAHAVKELRYLPNQ